MTATNETTAPADWTDLKIEVEGRRAGFPIEAKTLPELREALEYALKPIDWTNINLPCGADDALAERREDLVEDLREMIAAHEDKGPAGSIVRRMSKMIRAELDKALTDWILAEMDRGAVTRNPRDPARV